MEYDNELYSEQDLEEMDLLDAELAHYGTKRHSGRYPWGSGENPYQHSGDWLARYEELRKEGLTETEIAESMKMSTTRLRAAHTIALGERRALKIQQAKSLKSDGLSNPKIAEIMGLPGESSVRSLLNEDSEAKMSMAEKTAQKLADLVDERGMIDVGKGTEHQLGISKEKMDVALMMLEMDGYEVYGGSVAQQTNPNQRTNIKVLCPPGTKHAEIYNYENVHSITDLKSYDGGDTFKKSFQYPESMDSSRLSIRYAEDGGIDKDGLVEIRRGVNDLSLGLSNYAQVRILVDGTHYIKGMAVYSDDLPEGTDILFNTNKKRGTDVKDVLKKIKDDPENPFGSAIKENGGQSYYIGDDGKEHLSLINKRSDEGDWGEWSKELSAQFLSKQPQALINRQLKMTISDKQDEFDEIMSLTNPTVKRYMLESFADDCDASSVHLKAASLPGTVYKVILPLPSLSNSECYCPQYEDGTQLALVRFPHAGTFEIPIVKVNNRNKEGQKYLTSNASDAIGINSKTASKLSGADFDGDTVLCIPLREGGPKIMSTPMLKDLDGFDPKMDYGPSEVRVVNGVEHYFRGDREFATLPKSRVQMEMGQISNLITDMTLQGATDGEKARAVKHSMVIVDANKHHLDYKKSAIDNRIDELKKKYQNGGGVSTLISRAKSPIQVNERKEGAFFTKSGNERVTLFDPENEVYVNESTGELFGRKDVRIRTIDPNTGEKAYRNTNREYLTVKYRNANGKTTTASVIEKDGKQYYKKDGAYVEVTDEKVKINKAKANSTKMAETNDAMTLLSNIGTEQELAYANYANKMKSLANRARLELINIKDNPYSPSAKQTYLDEFESLKAKQELAALNKPRERRAQLIAESKSKAKIQSDPTLTDEQKKKIRQQELTKARIQAGAARPDITITDREWEAIQAGAISANMLKQLMSVANKDRLYELSMPKTSTTVSDSKIRRIKNMAASGYTIAEIADTLGLSTSTVTNYTK